jgi:hypothetical protein
MKNPPIFLISILIFALSFIAQIISRGNAIIFFWIIEVIPDSRMEKRHKTCCSRTHMKLKLKK